MNFEMDFISGDTKKCLLAVSLPMLAAMFLNMAYNLVDSLWIGNLMGETAYAALTGATPLILILESALYPLDGISGSGGSHPPVPGALPRVHAALSVEEKAVRISHFGVQ